MKAYEMKLNKREIGAFKSILTELKTGVSARCPHHEGDVYDAQLSSYCQKMCAKLFPSLTEQGNLRSPYSLHIFCPCTTLSRAHKIKVVRKLLTHNNVKL